MCKVSTNLLFQATYNIKTEKQTINSTYLVSVRSGRLAEGKGLEIDVPSEMSRRLTIQDNELATVLSVHAPTMQAETRIKEAFYRDPHNLLRQVDSKDELLILGDFNARVGRGFELWKGVLGRHEIGSCNDNGLLLLEFCSEHQLVITNTRFLQKDRFKETWRHPSSEHWHLLDYALTRQHDTRDKVHTRVMPSADCYTDHRLVRCKVAFASRLLPRGKVARRRNCKCTHFMIQG